MNAAVTPACPQAHDAVATYKPAPTADIEAKFDYVRAKYERKAFTQGGDGEVVRRLRATSSSSATVTKGQVHAGIAIVKFISGSDLRVADLNGKSDPYVILSNGSGTMKVTTQMLQHCTSSTLYANATRDALHVARDTFTR